MKKIISTSVVLTTIVSARNSGVSTDKYIDSSIYFI